MKVIFSEEAKAGLREIALFIARDNKDRARSFVRELRAKAQDIARMPEAFPVVPRYEQSEIRRRVYRDYLIFYQVRSGSVYIIDIFHGAQHYEAFLFPGT